MRQVGLFVFGSLLVTGDTPYDRAEREIIRASLIFFINVLDKYRPESRLKYISENHLAKLDQHQEQDAAPEPLPSISNPRWFEVESAVMKKKYIDNVLTTISDVQVINGTFHASVIRKDC